MQTHTELKAIRERRGISVAQLAREVGVSRQTVYAMEAGSYVPNTSIALQLARVLEVTVEELFQLEPEPLQSAQPITARLLAVGATPAPGQPLQLCRVGRRMMAVPVPAQPLYLPAADAIVAEPADAESHVGVLPLPGGGEEEKRVLVAGCDPGISVLARHLHQTAGVEMVAAPCSSRQALEWLRDGFVHVAGSHLRDTATGDFNLGAVDRIFPKGGVHIVTFAVWEQGLLAARGNPKEIASAADLARPGIRIVNREPGAGSRDLLVTRLRDSGIEPESVAGFDRIAYGHLPAAFQVATGEADCCLATRAAARVFGLHFIPLETERYDLVYLARHASLPAVQALLDGLNRASVRRRLEALGGYDTSEMGRMLR